MDHKKLIKVGIVPTFKEEHKNQIDLSFDLRINDLLNKIFKSYKLLIIKSEKDLNDINFVIFCGGNDLIKFNKSKRNIMRNILDIKILKLCVRKKITVLGICYGMQMIANHFKSKIVKKKNHIDDHKINFLFTKKKIKVNSFHNYAVIKLGNALKPIAIANDQTYEAFKHKTKKILGIMWHPERYKKIKKIDVDLIIKYLCN